MLYKGQHRPPAGLTVVHEYFETTSGVVMEKRLLKLLREHNWNVPSAAEEIGASPATLWRVIKSRSGLRQALIKGRAERELRGLRKVS